MVPKDNAAFDFGGNPYQKKLRGTPPQRPNTAVDSRSLKNRWAQVGKQPTAADENYFFSYANPPERLPAGTPKGKWVYSPEQTQKVLWEYFKGQELVWTDDGRSDFNREAACQALKAKNEAEKVEVPLPPIRGAGPGPVAELVWDHLEPDLKTFLTEPLGAVQEQMQSFMLDIGFSVPLLNTIKSAVMMTYSGYKAGLAAWSKDVVEVLVKEEKKQRSQRKTAPLFKLGTTSVLGHLDQKMNYALVDLGGYTFDLVASAAPIPAGVSQGTAIARLLLNLRRLYKTWSATQEINKVLASNDPGKLLPLIEKHNLLGCYIFRMHKQVITGHFPGLDQLSLEQQADILNVLGVDRERLQEQAQRLDKLRYKAEKLINGAPYLLRPIGWKKVPGSGKDPKKTLKKLAKKSPRKERGVRQTKGK